jgi:hypothetical protein
MQSNQSHLLPHCDAAIKVPKAASQASLRGRIISQVSSTKLDNTDFASEDALASIFFTLLLWPAAVQYLARATE